MKKYVCFIIGFLVWGFFGGCSGSGEGASESQLVLPEVPHIVRMSDSGVDTLYVKSASDNVFSEYFTFDDPVETLYFDYELHRFYVLESRGTRNQLIVYDSDMSERESYFSTAELEISQFFYDDVHDYVFFVDATNNNLYVASENASVPILIREATENSILLQGDANSNMLFLGLENNFEKQWFEIDYLDIHAPVASEYSHSVLHDISLNNQSVFYVYSNSVLYHLMSHNNQTVIIDEEGPFELPNSIVYTLRSNVRLLTMPFFISKDQSMVYIIYGEDGGLVSADFSSEALDEAVFELPTSGRLRELVIPEIQQTPHQ